MFIDTPTGAEVADKAIQGVLSRVDALAGKLGIAANQLWSIYVGQARVEAVRDFAFVALGILAVVLGSFGFKVSWFRAKKSNTDTEEFWGFLCFAAAAVVIGGVFLVLSFFYDAVGEWLNPQYWAFKHLTGDLKNLF